MSATCPNCKTSVHAASWVNGVYCPCGFYVVMEAKR